ncbi:YdcH family protein [Yunchengibacter salinarum]|uniref:YdcH family protein n=1 Tax=Yunchengibacter salinarum TaxID=3133399 RepID=UPI0035B5BA70
MSMQTHVEALNSKHARIENAIHTEETRPNPDTIRLMQMKREKLRLKEEISRLKAH